MKKILLIIVAILLAIYMLVGTISFINFLTDFETLSNNFITYILQLLIVGGVLIGCILLEIKIIKFIKNYKENTTINNRYVKKKNIIYRIDGKPITNEEIPFLIKEGYNSIEKKYQNSKNPKFHRTEKEEIASTEFYIKNENFIQPREQKIVELYQSATIENDLIKQISLLKNATNNFNILKNYCYSNGEPGKLYFQDTWEHCHNSTNEDFSYLDTIDKLLNIALEERKIFPLIINIIKENYGILQKDIYKKMPNINSSLILKVIKRMDKQNIIKRIKTNNSYKVFINEDEADRYIKFLLE